jgi:uncharacterized protein (TIGR00266 family)
MQIEILDQPANSYAKVSFAPGESITTEGGSMIAMSHHLKTETTTHKRGKGGIGKALKRAVGGESLFLNHYTAEEDRQTLYLAPKLSGNIFEHKLDEKGIVIQGSSFMAHWGNVDLDMSWQGFKTMFSGERMFWLKAKGDGSLLLNSFGDIYPIDVNDDYTVDTGHIVAFEDTLDFKISKVGDSWISSFLGGEGIVCKFKGQGRVWCQSHTPLGYGQALGPNLKPL